VTDDIHRLIGAVYESALSTDGMGVAAQHVAREFEAVAAWHYVMRPGSAEVYVNSGAHGFDETTVAQYQDGIWKEDFAVPAAQIPGITFETHELLSAKARDANEFSRWLKRQAGSHRLIGRSVAAADGLVAGLALHFPNGLLRRPEERLKFDLIAPHFGRAFQLAGRFTEAMDQRATLALGVERLRQAVLLLDRAGRVVWANAAGRDLLRRDDGISLSGQRLRFRGLGEAAAFERARRVVRLGVGLTTPAGSLTLPVARPSGRPNYVIEVFETPPAVVAAFGSTSKLLVMIHDPDVVAEGRADVWRAMFGLTEAETRVARGLQRGLGDEAIAQALGVKVSTVRSHIREVLEKTGARSKLELAHLLTSVG
jgi:DNA-binding CsgD family transcriptional regulator/PAS domain-containing protein